MARTPDLSHFEEMLDFLERASKEEAGIELTFESEHAAHLYRKKIYKVREELGGYPELSFIHIKHKLWIVKGYDRHA